MGLGLSTEFELTRLPKFYKLNIDIISFIQKEFNEVLYKLRYYSIHRHLDNPFGIKLPTPLNTT